MQNKSYTKTAGYFGVSKQRIHQLLKKSPDPQVQAMVGNLRAYRRPTRCCVCARPFGPQLALACVALCEACRSYQRSPVRHTRIRTVLYPVTCRTCGTALQKGKRANGLCGRCYQRGIAHTPAQRESVRRWQLAHPEQYRASVKRATQKWQAAHPEQYRAIQHRAYLRRKDRAKQQRGGESTHA